jgi:anti-anti-sigma regulatory factor
MEFQVLGPVSGPGFVFIATFVRAAGRGTASDPERLVRALEVAIPDHDITIDLREVEELGSDGIEALLRVSRRIHEWRAGRLFLLATPDEAAWRELESSDLTDVVKHPRVYLAEAGKNHNRHSN